MNAFALHTNPRKAAEYHCDQHLNSQLKEAAQLLSTAIFMVTGRKWSRIYLPCYINHPINKWARASYGNFQWLYALGDALSKERRYRFPERDWHKSYQVLIHAGEIGVGYHAEFPSQEQTPFAMAMPDHYKCSDAVLAYRRYYFYEKGVLRGAPVSWTKREMPHWMKEI